MTSHKTVIKMRWVLPVLMLGFLWVGVSDAASIYVGGSADPYQKIQNAIDAASSRDTIIVRSGTYSENLRINKYLTLRSQNGAGQTIIQPSGGSDVITVSASGVTIRGFTVRNGTQGIKLGSQTNCHIQDSVFTGNTCAIYAYHSGVTIENNQITGNKYGIYFDGAGSTIKGNTISNHSESGIEIYQAHDSRIEHNTLENNNNGIRFRKASSQTVVNNNLNRNGIAVNVWYSSGIAVSYNTISNCRTTGVNLDHSSSNSIAHNTVNHNTNTEYAGISLHDYSRQNTMSGNTVTSNGVGIAVFSDSNTISDNQFDQNYWIAVRVVSDGNIITNNTLTNGTEGIFLDHAKNNIISGNTAHGHDGKGIFLDSSSDGNTVSGNNLSGNSNAGVMIKASSSNLIQANTIESNANFGINVDKANSNIITANTIRWNGLCGVQLSDSGDNTVYNNILDNASNGCDNNGGNSWSVAAKPGGNIIGGPYLGGNSWSDYPGRDLDGDGLGDTDVPHTSSDLIFDGGDPHPLVQVGSNTPPIVPGTPLPVDGAVYQNTAPRLTWKGGDADPGDMVTYALQLGKTFPLSQVAEDLSDTEFDPGVLDDGDTYLWQVTATDSLSLVTRGPVWRFTVDSSVFGSYLFEEDSDTLADASGGDQTGTVIGAEFASGIGVAASNAFRFSWSDSDYVRIPRDAAQSAIEALTVEAWIYPTAWDNAFTGYNRIVSKQPVYLLRGCNGRAHFQILTENYGYFGIFDSQVMTLNTWHHVVGTFDGQELKLYVDGQLRNSSALPSSDLIVDNDADICIGEYPLLAEGFTGLIDNVTLLKRAETEAEVRASYVNIVQPDEWVDLGNGVVGADILSDGKYLYRVGGIGHCTNIYRYDGLSQNTWALLTNENPQCWSHFSPGEGNRSWYYGGKIIVAGHSHPGHPGGNKVTIYDIANDTWSSHELPLIGDYNNLSWGQLGALNAITGKVYISWTEEGLDTEHKYVTSALNIANGIWGPTYDRDSRIGEGSVVLEDTSGKYVFDLIQGDRYVRLLIYNLEEQPEDFSGTWIESSRHDMGDGHFFMDAAKNIGSDVMAWNPQKNKLYLVATEHGVTLEYDPDADSWIELPQRPIGHGYRDGHVAIVGDYLYSQNGDKLWCLSIP